MHRKLTSPLALVTLIMLVLAALASRAATRAVAMPDTRAANAAALRATAARQGGIRVIATLNAPFQPEPRLAPADVNRQRAAIRAVSDKVLAQLAGTHYQLNATFYAYPLLGLSVEAAGLEALLRSPDVRGVAESRPKHPSDLASNMVIGADLTANAGYTGAGYSVAVFDTGVQTSHPFLAGKTVAEACFSRTAPDDPTTPEADATVTLCPNGQSTTLAGAPGQIGSGAGANCAIALCHHGTHVAGIALGKDYANGPGYDGVAPDAQLIAVQVFSQSNEPSYCLSSAPCLFGHDEDILAALQYVQTTLAANFTIAAVNMSLGDDTIHSTPCDSSPYVAAVASLRALDIASVIAAGNNGYSNALASPACAPNAISVGATTNADAIASFSNRASYLSLFAPGWGIQSSFPNNAYGSLSGTSMATPHVAGAWAVMRQRYPTESVSQLLDRLQTTGKPIDSGDFSTARIQLDTAVLTTSTPTPTLTLVPNKPIWLPVVRR
jgi:subtilisin family serine protease